MTKEKTLTNFSLDQIALIKSQITPKATNEELDLFIYQAQRTGLDPLTRQIYAIHRSCKEKQYGKDVWVSKMTIQTSIDGFRVIAERSGDYGGQGEPIFDESNGLKSCKITVYRFRGDNRYAASVGVAYFSEYNQDNNTWKKMPRTMIAKVAEALALRKAYPQDLSGLYTGDEMGQAENENQIINKDPESKDISDEWKDSEQGKLWISENFKLIKQEIESCESEDDLKAVWKGKSVDIARLKRYAKDMFDLLSESKEAMKLTFELETPE